MGKSTLNDSYEVEPLVFATSTGAWDTECYFSFPMTVSCTYMFVLDTDVADEK